MELGKTRIWNKKTFLEHPRIRVGGYPGFVDCKVKKEKLVSLVIEKDKDDPSVQTVKEPIRNHYGQTAPLFGNPFGELDKSEAFNRRHMPPEADLRGRRVTMLPVKSNSKAASNVPVIWYDAEGRILYDKKEILPATAPAKVPVGFRMKTE